jgi:AcrR family transcriptional regulator
MVTMEAIAERAGVGKPTIYRWWPNRHAVTMAALMDADSKGAEVGRPAVSALARLETQLRTIARRFSERNGRHIGSLIAASDADSELSKAFRTHFIFARRQEGRTLLLEAAARGEIPSAVNVDVALDMIYGALFFRLLLGHAPLSDAFVKHLIRQIFPANATPRGRC